MVCRVTKDIGSGSRLDSVFQEEKGDEMEQKGIKDFVQ
jgi:hypothetical protein